MKGVTILRSLLLWNPLFIDSDVSLLVRIVDLKTQRAV
jgi:hypothetical protein